MSAKKRALCSLGISLEAMLVWFFWRTFSFHNAKQPSIAIANIHAPAAHVLTYVVGKDNALVCSVIVMALFWSAVFFFAVALAGKLKHHEPTVH
jgi:hypothetical protein